MLCHLLTKLELTASASMAQRLTDDCVCQWFPGMSLTYFLNDLEMVPVAPIITGITLVFTFHMCCISIVRSLYFKIFLASFLITFLSPGIAMSINMHVLFSLSQIIMSVLLLETVLSVCTC